MVGGVTTRGVVGVGATEGAGTGAGAAVGDGVAGEGELGNGFRFDGTEIGWTPAGAEPSRPLVGSPTDTATEAGMFSASSVGAGSTAPSSTDEATTGGCSMASAVMIVHVAARLSPTVSTRAAGAACPRRRFDDPAGSGTEPVVSETTDQLSDSETTTASRVRGLSISKESSCT